jgi:hypothetical protein
VRHRTLVTAIVPSQLGARSKVVERDPASRSSGSWSASLLEKTLPPPRAAALEASRLVIDDDLAGADSE